MASFFPSSFPTTSAKLAEFITDETGTGALVFATSPTLVTPTLGAASATSLTLTTPLAAAQGGTGISSYAVGDLIYASASATLNKLADIATGNVLRSGGVNTAPAWGKVNLTTDITNTLAVANGGTGAATFTANTILIGNGTSAVGSIALGTANQILGMNAGATANEYKTVSGTTNQITVTHAAGSITLAAPQNLHTSATPQFARLGLGVAADGTDILTITQTSTVANSKGLNISHTGAITGTGYGGYFSKTGASTTNVSLYATATGATNNYAAIFEAGDIGIGITIPISPLHILRAGTTNADLLISQTGTGRALIGLDASDGDFVGDDYLSFWQDNANLNGHISVGQTGATRNLILQENGGNVGIFGIPNSKFEIFGDNARPFSIAKSTVAVVAPGAGIGMLRWEVGTNAGTLKLVGYSGTSTTGVTIVDNVGSGN